MTLGAHAVVCASAVRAELTVATGAPREGMPAAPVATTPGQTTRRRRHTPLTGGGGRRADTPWPRTVGEVIARSSGFKAFSGRGGSDASWWR